MGCASSAEVMAVLTEIQDHRADWVALDAEVGAGLTAIANAWIGCCNRKADQAEAEITYEYTALVPDADGVLQPVQMMKKTPLAGQGFAGSCAAAQAYETSQSNWAAQYAKWLEMQKEWQDNQQALSILATIANLSQLCTALECRNQMYDKAKGKIDTMISICDAPAAKIKTGGSALTAYCTHAGLYPGTGDAAYTMANTGKAITTYSGWQSTLYNLWANDGAGGGLAYEDIQADHIDNMATHLAQLCTNARDISNDLKTCLQTMDDVWKAGGNWQLFENCLFEGENNLADQLCKANVLVADCQDQMKMCGDSLAKCFATDDGMGGMFVDTIKPAIKDMISNMSEMDGVIDDLQTLTADAMKCVTDLKDNYNAVIDPVEAAGGAVEQILANADCLFGDEGEWKGTTFMKDCVGMLQECAVDKKEIFERYLGELTENGSSGEYCLGRVIIDQACGLVKNLDNAVQFLGEHKEDCLAIYENTYEGKENALAIALLNSGCDLADCFLALKTFLTTHSEDMDACWEDAYQEGEKAWATTLLAEANELAATHKESFDFLCECAEEAKACWSEDYAPKEKDLALAVMQEACDLAPCVSLAHEWLCERADFLKDRYDEFWAPKEDEYVCALFEKALLLCEESDNCLQNWCTELDEQFLEWWKCYEDQEKIVGPKLIGAGEDACEKNIEMYNEVCDRSAHLWQKFDGDFCPCDLEDLQYHCDIWNKTNFLEEICENNECVQGLGETLKRCYEQLVLPCEKEYIEEVCKLVKYEPKYCEMEDRAVLHVRKRYDMEADELERCITPYCKGAFVDRVADLRDAQFKAEQLSIQLADRWEWLRETQECDRRHRYKMEIFELGERYAINSAAFYEQSSRGNDVILQRIHERISRGYQYMNGAFNQSQSTLNAAAQAIDSSIRAIDVGHFWPSWWNDGRSRYMSATEQRLSHVQGMFQVGQRHHQDAIQAKQGAAQIAQNAIDDGGQMIDRGHNLLNQAISSKVQANNVAAQTADDALQAIDRGHFFIDAAHRDRQLMENTARDAAQLAQRSVDQGHNHKKMALDAATSEWQGAHAGVQDGLASIDRGHWWLENMREDKRLAMQGYQDAWRNFQGQLQTAHQQMELALAWDRAATDKLRLEMDNGFKGMDYMLNTFNAAQRKQEAALNAGIQQMDGANAFLRTGYEKLRMQLSTQVQTQGMIPQSTNALINMAHEGNQTFLMGAHNTALQEARLRKECEKHACDIIRGAYNDLARVATNAGCCVLGPVLGSAANLDNEVANYGAGVFSGLSGAVGPPPQPNFVGMMNSPPALGVQAGTIDQGQFFSPGVIQA